MALNCQIPVERLTDQLETTSLVQDDTSDEASTPRDVNVGNFSDSDDLAGMAHAVEHLLFMGTKKKTTTPPTFPHVWTFEPIYHTYVGRLFPHQNAQNYDRTAIILLFSADALRNHMLNNNTRFGKMVGDTNTDTTDYFELNKHSLIKAPDIVPKDYVIEGELMGTSLKGIVDTGAQCNFISMAMAKRLGISPAPGTRSKVLLGSGKLIESQGIIASLQWVFRDESKPHFIDFTVLPKCTNDLIFGYQFLSTSKTLTRMKERMKAIIRPWSRRLHMNYLGSETKRLWGFLNGKLATALPDTGSDVMLVSAEYAHHNKLEIDDGLQHHLEVEFVDGSMQFTSGIVKDISWSFGDTQKSVKCDFYVLDGLPMDIILSNEFLFGLNVFSKFKDYFVDTDQWNGMIHLCNIRLISQYSDNLQVLEDEYLDDFSSLDPFSPLKVEAELVRRDRIRDAINGLKLDDQQDASNAEIERRRRWDIARELYLENQQTQPLTGQSVGPTNHPPDTTACRSSRRAAVVGWFSDQVTGRWRTQGRQNSSVV